MSSVPDEIASYFAAVGALQASPEEIEQAHRVRIVRRAPRGHLLRSTAIALCLMIVGGAAVAGAAAIIGNSDPRPPAREASDPITPDGVGDVLSIFRRPQVTAEIDLAATAADGIREPYEMDSASIRVVGRTPLGRETLVVFARVDPRSSNPEFGRPEDRQEAGVFLIGDRLADFVITDGPYAVADIRAGSAVGIMEVPGDDGSRSVASGLVPDGVASVELGFARGSRLKVPVTSNVFSSVLASSQASGRIESILWFGDDGVQLKAFTFA